MIGGTSMLKPQQIFSCFILLMTVASVSGCQRQPPDHRPFLNIPTFTQGNIQKGKQLYEQECQKCHKLNVGDNKKGPQLMNVYGAPAALLKDYKYSEALKNTGWTWDAQTLDTYIKDAQKAVPNTRMHADPIDDAQERLDIISYLSSLQQQPKQELEH